ncbi:sensor histidine kinase [Pelomicrobium sp.]|jgi:two-component system sensor histidine kinase TctE|uniref:sensor histidine kinase n=1 Tax=Pelomicrobium sp. TaxID=2815319 RepID=UPI002FDDDC42
MPAESRPPVRSLFIEILDWMFLPLLLVWPLSVVVTYFVAHAIADQAYDQELEARLHLLQERLRWRDGRLFLADPATESTATPASPDGLQTFYQVSSRDGTVLAGEAAPAISRPVEPEARVRFENGRFHGRHARLAYALRPVPGAAESPALVILVGETTERRDRLASSIVSGIILPQFLIVPFAMLLVLWALRRGLQPLERLQRDIRETHPDRLRPIDQDQAPEEIRPVVLAMNELIARLERLLQAQQRFVSHAAHQMRTPLAGLKTQAQLALRLDPAPELKASLEQIAASAQQASRLVSQLLALARAEATGAGVPFVRLDLVPLVRETVAEFYDRAVEKGLELGFECEQPQAIVRGHGALLRELTSNLVDNALRYTPPPGSITVRVLARPQVVLQVEDTGIGIDPKERALVFERFYRVLGTGEEGSGLGLAIVRSIAEAHGASISLESNPAGIGTRVSVAFPPGLEADSTGVSPA